MSLLFAFFLCKGLNCQEHGFTLLIANVNRREGEGSMHFAQQNMQLCKHHSRGLLSDTLSPCLAKDCEPVPSAGVPPEGEQRNAADGDH